MEWSLIKASCTLKWGRDGGDEGVRGVRNYQEQSGLRVSGKKLSSKRGDP